MIREYLTRSAEVLAFVAVCAVISQAVVLLFQLAAVVLMVAFNSVTP